MKRLICFLFGHDYRLIETKVANIGMISDWPVYRLKCKRCGKIKDEFK